MNQASQANDPLMDRRNFLGSTVTGLGAVALTQLLSKEGLLADNRIPFDPARPHKARGPHFPAKAKNVLYCFAQVPAVNWNPGITNPNLFAGTALPCRADLRLPFRDPQATWPAPNTISDLEGKRARWYQTCFLI